jgi:hypothetical protein
MDMFSKLLAPLSVIATLLLAGCGGHTSSSTATQPATQAAVATPATHSAAPARRAVTARLRRRALGPHSSNAPAGLEDTEGPQKSRNRRALPARSYRLTVTGRSGRVTSIKGGNVGVVRLVPKTRQICWQFARLPTVVVRTAAFGQVRMILRPENASIHAGTKGATGPVVAALYRRYVPRGCTAIAPVVLNSILSAPRLYYLSLGSAISPTGALRAQL